MYIATVPNRTSTPTYLIRESIRSGNRVGTRTIANITHWPKSRILALKALLRGEFDDVNSRMPTLASGLIFGTSFVLSFLADMLGISKALGQSAYARLALFLIIARIAHQGSRLSAVRWSKQHAIDEILGLEPFDEDMLYNTLAWLDTYQQRIENKLFKNMVIEHGQQPTMVLYDVTSSYFEGTQNELSAYGYNRDGKKGKQQIVIGLMTDVNGEPIAIKVFEGNTSDPKTIYEQIQTMKKRFCVKNLVFVGDRGMIKTNGKLFLQEAGFKYITALTNPQIRTLLTRNIIQPELFDQVIHEVETKNNRYVLRCNGSMRQKAAYRRDDKLIRLAALIDSRNQFVATSKSADVNAGLNQLKKWVIHHKLNGFVTLTLNERTIECKIDHDAKDDDALLDGCYVLETDVPANQMDKTSIDNHYKNLQQVEQDFSKLKTTLLEIRPIFVRKAEHTRGHVFVSMLALKIVRCMEKKLSEAFGTTQSNTQAITLPDALQALSRWCYATYTENNISFQTLLEPDNMQKKILQALNIPIPNRNAKKKRDH